MIFALCDRAFDAPKEEGVIKAGNRDIIVERINVRRRHEAEMTWMSLMTTCQGIVFDTYHAWSASNRSKIFLEPDTTTRGEKRRLHRMFNTMAMSPGESPESFVLRASRLTKQLERMAVTVTAVLLKFI